MNKFIALTMLVCYRNEEWFNFVYINRAKCFKLKINVADTGYRGNFGFKLLNALF